MNCARSWLYLQEYIGMHSERNIKCLHKFHSEILTTVPGFYKQFMLLLKL
jgi:hypothetical protein